MTDEQLDLLFMQLVKRQEAEMDRLTVAVASAGGIVMGGQKAFEAWQQSRQSGPMPPTSIEAQRATLGRLASLLPDNVKVH